MKPATVESIMTTLGAAPRRWQAAQARGCTANNRWIVHLDDGRSAFAKEAVDERTAEWLRQEYLVYSHLQAAFMPKLLGWCDDGDWPLLIIEDLHEAHWPPPWSEASIAAVRRTLAELAALPVPRGLRRHLPFMAESLRRWPGWHTVAEDPRPFLSLGFCSAVWLERHLPALLAAAAAADLNGDSIVHMDTRSDNLCLRDGRAILVDWNWARIGNPLLDLAGWLPSLHAEGGPLPDALMPAEAAGLAAVLTGYWAANAGLPPVPGAPRVRPLQLVQLQSAFPWTVRALRLPEPEPVAITKGTEDLMVQGGP